MRKLAILLIFLVCVFIGGFLWIENGKKAVNDADKSQKIFVIEKGQDLRQIASNLKREGFIRDPVVFFLIIKTKGLDRKIQAGDYRLSPSMDIKDLIDNLQSGRIDTWITVREGLRAQEISEILAKNFPSYSSSWERVLAENEGYLFPDTYLISGNADIDQIVQIMRSTFEKKYDSIPNIKNSTLAKEEIVIIASLVEREAKSDEDRLLVASVILNRLKIGMKLDIDATLQYVLGYQKNEKRWWKKELTDEDKKTNSSYNTYLFAGLPPGPICNPGMNSISAVVNAPKTDYLYYVSDKTGKNHFAKTLAQHNINVVKYLSR